MDKLKIMPQTQGRQVIYEYGVRVNADSERAIDLQIRKARAMYNEIVAVMRTIYDEMQVFVLDHATPEARDLVERIEQHNVDFKAAKARDDRSAMLEIARARREDRKSLYPLLQEVRKTHKGEIAERFYSRIGMNSRCDTYACRGVAVKNGLGAFTANKVLEAALQAWQKSMQRGRPPRFAVGAEKMQDTLTIQFSQAGGCAVEELFTGKRRDCVIEYPKNGFRKRSYTPFRFRLGAATDEVYAQGTVQVDREPPQGSRIALVRLVRKVMGPKYRYALQCLLSLPEPVRVAHVGRRQPLVALHFGWNFEETGRRLAGISANGDVLDAGILSLPPSIEQDLREATEIQSSRDASRDAVVQRLKAEMILPDDLPEEDALRVLWDKLRRLPAQYVSANRLHHLAALLKERNCLPAASLPEWLEVWRKSDRMAWQKQVYKAKSARNRRMTFYRKTALDLARQYEAVVLEMPDLKKAAEKLDEKTGEKTEWAKKARAGRVIAALYSLESALHWAACKCGTAVLHLSGEETIGACSLCGGAHVTPDPEDGQTLYCEDCGSAMDRKKNGAANAWQLANAQLEPMVTKYWETVLSKTEESALRKAEKSAKMAAGRKAASAARKAIVV
ncbi:transposase [Acidithiobacillus ferrooxidans]|uniref:transposase n=1 Tax=Acidithiobacillus ferrooxidans TaxID=920 RepID=UPI0021482A33|nr:transposase [Acidithiobacillus ferrooxidans]MCR1347332.1 transposase [Acidithiobacillus ferrooxidans]MCR1354807.1 transposase [Acidithiobacillus ferrooxidans]